MKLSVLMPVYNEKRWLDKIVALVMGQDVPGISDREIIMVDDASSDGTAEIVKELGLKYPGKVKTFFHSKNQGKGAAVRTAIENITGEVCIIQDADLEYSPSDYPNLLAPILDGRADCVYGSRFVGSEPKRVFFFWHYVGNRAITFLSNMFTNLNLSDMETGYKAFRCEVLKTITITSNRFGIEPEITSKIAKKKYRIYEVGISYQGRTYEEGKKITWIDGMKAIWTIIRFH